MSIDYSIINKRFGDLTVINLDHIDTNRATHWRCKCVCGNEIIVRRSSLVGGHTTSCGCRKRGVERENLIGNKYGFLTVIDIDSDKSYNNTAHWVCKCDCGKIVTVRGASLKSGHTKSCGCIGHGQEMEDLSGKRFGRLTVIKFDHMDKHYSSHWLCRCNCGNEVIVSRGNLVKGRAKSCGCLKVDIQRERHTTHGQSTSRLHNIWSDMKQRCGNEKNDHYDLYGGRGISVCDEWADSFETFKDWANDNGYSDELTIDRKNNDGNYNPDNCRWVDQITQVNNRRNTRFFTYNNETRSVADWARLLNVSINVLYYRLGKNDTRLFEKYFNK